MKYRLAASIATAALSFAAVAMTPTDAEACGGFFCDQQQPINQAAERIIFSDNPDGTVTAVVQILYQGPSEEFAWVLPVPSVPEVSVSSNLAFQRLQNATNPQYTMNTEVEGECAQREFEDRFAGEGGNNANNTNNVNNTNNTDNQGPVNVLDQGTVGPYDYTVIEVDGSVTDPVTPATDWLTENGYDITALGPEVIRPYLEEGMKLLAFKLTKNAMSGDIRPVILNYETDIPSIPIKLTAVAANDDMGVLTWVLGESRSVPLTYKSLVINDALINWFNPAPTYDAVISRAADEAQGQGFVTEFAGDAQIAEELIFTARDVQNWEYISQTDWSSRQAELVQEAWQYYAGDFNGAWDGWPETINEVFSGLSEVEARQIIECAPCNPQVIPTGFDTAAFIATLEENVITPMEDTQELLDARPYMTRLYTTMSAAEMTQDPVFDFNADLPDQSNQNTATRYIECSPDVYREDAPWRAELPSGLIVRGQGDSRIWPLDPTDDIPANTYILQDSTEGDGEIVEDNVQTIQQGLEMRAAALPDPPRVEQQDNQQDPDTTNDGLGGGPKSSDSACSMVGASALPVGLVIGFFAMVGLRRRR